VGCGRCIAWCPVGIDIVEEASAVATRDRLPVTLPEPRSYARVEGDGMLPHPTRVIEAFGETADVVTLAVEKTEGFSSRPGQFNMLSLPGIGDIPISIAGTSDSAIEHTIRGVGAVSRALTELLPGSWLGLRGPFGSAWPMQEAEGRDVVLIAGGIGMAPLRGAMRQLAAAPDRYPRVRLLYGTRSPEDIVYDKEILGWMQLPHVKAHVTVDKGSRRWAGNVGVVTKLMRRKYTPPDGIYLLCGPEVMMRFALAELEKAGVPHENIYVSMERNMKCALGMCGRCQYGPYFICKDGPVFRYDQIAFLFGKPGY
jgi:NAD(P)H-flavin reductase